MTNAGNQPRWRQIGVCPDWQCDERLWHAALSEDGTKCFVAGYDSNVYIVWDIEKQSVIWRDDGSGGDSELKSLEEWVGPDGYLELSAGPARGRYRVFGLNINHAKTQSAGLDEVLEVDARSGTVLVRDKNSSAIVCKLDFDAFSGDWAFASFSDNDATIAVIEPYSVTFFQREQDTVP
jgi:WD40 repeat protein